jgi:stearoyl-CoA desaturase (delta-9 desaturase)
VATNRTDTVNDFTYAWHVGRFALVHLACLGAIWTGVHLVDVVVMLVLYVVRMFGVTAGYHRYFSHRSYKMGRGMQLVMALLAMSSLQKGVLWWASHHRRHHRLSDQPGDVHSPRLHGFWWSHVGWIVSPRYDATDLDAVGDLARYPELRWLDRHPLVPPLALAALVTALFGWSGLVVGFVWSTVLLWHGTFTINSLSHVFGSRRYATTDDSRNNWLLALITLGEGWHNNHHHYQRATNQGFFWWELDVTFLGLRALAAVGLVRDLRRPPAHVLEAGRERAPRVDAPAAGRPPELPPVPRFPSGSIGLGGLPCQRE